MRTVRRLLYREILGSTAFVMAAFLGLFFFIDLVSSIDKVGRDGVTIGHVLMQCLLQMPGHIYELMPITLLIGAIYALARLAQSSEYTILRTGGLGPGRALSLLALLGLGFALFTFVIGDVVAPWSETRAILLEADRSGNLDVGRMGAWLRGSMERSDGEHRYTVNVGVARSDGEVEQVRIFEFGPQGDLLNRMVAQRALIDPDSSTWQLEEVHITHWQPSNGRAASATTGELSLPAEPEYHARLSWDGGLTRSVVAAAVLPLSTMTTAALYTYMSHLSEQEQAAQRYEIQFWKKALYPLACLVMMALALPFAYLHGRSGGISYKVFGGIMLGISFVLLNNVSGHLGLLRNWTPWIAASAPSAIYLLLSLGAFSWLVRYR
jgi:lipopolysaccharide export system permease protein